MTAFVTLFNIAYTLPDGRELFRDVSATFAPGCRAAIVGDNGTGKTTLLKIVAGDLAPAAGTVERQAKFHVVPQFPQNETDTRSGGERQRARLDEAFASAADVLFFDEPTNNLDRQARKDFYRRIERSRSGIVVVSHDRELLERMNTTL